MPLDTILYRAVKPLLFRLDAETAHDLVSAALRQSGQTRLTLALLRAVYEVDDPLLAVSCAGLRFRNPLGVAAGFDKRAALVAPLAALGFGHVEVGTVTPRPQPGNDRPRMFRLPEDHALVNRLGFNSPGMVAVGKTLRATDHRPPTADHLQHSESPSRVAAQPPSERQRAQPPSERQRAQPPSERQRAVPPSRAAAQPPSERQRAVPPITGINIGKNRDTPLHRAAEDYAAAFVALAPFADYVTVNISSPNTPGLRQLQGRDALDELLGRLTAHNARLAQPRPIFVKISPDEPDQQLNEIVAAALAHGVDGLIATNTTLDRTGLRSAAANETGGLSGAPLTERARRVIAALHSATGGALPIVGVGGVASAADAYGHIRAGASLVQLYTGMVYGGPGTARDILRGLGALLRRDGYATLAAAVGADAATLN